MAKHPADGLAEVAAVNRVLLACWDLSVCNWTTPLIDGDRRLGRRFVDDGTHPNPAGVAIMGVGERPVDRVQIG
jgi:lysophospholipase L1-like esterase